MHIFLPVHFVILTNYWCSFNNYDIVWMQGAADVKRIASENKIMEPYVIILGSPENHSQAFLVIDCDVIGEINDIKLVPLVLIASYYVFNICYPKGLSSFYSVLEIIVLSSPLDKTSPSVKHVYASIMSNN